MLKKLLASALAVATVASCAYVPSALASAATTYKTATAVAYQDWQLKNPDAPAAAKDTVTIYVSSANTPYVKKVAPENNNEEYIKENLNKVTEATIVSAADSKAAVKTEVVYVGKAGTNVYVVQVASKKAVLFSTYKDATTSAAATIDTDALAKVDVQVLGYYESDSTGAVTAAGKTAALQDANKYTSEAKLAGKEFAGWTYGTAATAANADVVAPAFADLTSTMPANYDTYTLNTASATKDAQTAYQLETGLYNTTDVITVPVLKSADAATKALMIKNYLKTQNKWTVKPSVQGTASVATTYSAYDVRPVTADGKTYAITYRADAAAPAANVKVTYDVQFYDVLTSGASQLIARMTGDYASANRYYTKDVEEIYTMLKGTTGATMTGIITAGGTDAGKFNKDTLAEYLAQKKTDNAVAGETAYVLTSTRTLENVNSGANVEYYVTIHAIVDQVTKYDVYSYAADNAVVKSAAWLTDAQVKVTDGKIAATAKDLDVATAASIDNVPAEYAYAAIAAPNVIYTTYKMGDAVGVELKDFQTAEGEFKSEPYFGRDAKVGDQVTLKVSLSETGVAKKLDLSKLDVKYAVSGKATVAKENYDYVATEFPAGEAIDITLGEGTNIVVATVYYNGTKVGTFEPFYAYVG